ncbi:hypothetical protein U8P76_08030 [Rhizobium johnstonii]|nr:hypothetical protein U8P76_08030 [Rhizobium johnstonii]
MKSAGDIFTSSPHGFFSPVSPDPQNSDRLIYLYVRVSYFRDDQGHHGGKDDP